MGHAGVEALDGGGHRLGGHVARHEHRKARLAVAHQDDLLGLGAQLLELLLEGLGGDVVAALGDDEVLDPSDDPQVAVLDVHLIARVEPALRVEGGGGLLGFFVVAGEHVGPAHEQLALVGGAHLHAVDGIAHPTRHAALGVVEGHDPRGLGQAVGLVDGDPQEREPTLGVLGQRRRPADQELEGRPHLAPDRLVDEGPGQGEGEAVGEARLPLAQAPEGVEAPVVEGGDEPAALAHLGADAVADPLEHGGDRQEVVGPRRAHLLHQVLEVGGDHEPVGAGQLRPEHQARGREAKGQEVEHPVRRPARADHLAEALDGARDHEVEVGPGQHDALGLAARAGRVDDRDGVVLGEIAPPRVAGGVGLEDPVEHRDLARLAVGGGDGRRQLVRRREQGLGAGVVQHDRQLLGVLPVVEGDHGGARREDRQVRRDPARRVGGQEGHLVAGTDPQAREEGPGPGDEFAQTPAVEGLDARAVHLVDADPVG